jgi:phosphopantetheinyl transferase (holo-ACP synthase)
MIGIDITKVSRFKSMKTLDRLMEKLNVDGNTPIAAAKTWACMEAIVKAEGKSFDYSKIQIKFPFNAAPLVIDDSNVLQYKYALSLTHEDDTVAAVAMRIIN